MIIGKVVGTVVATRKNDRLVGSKLLIVEPLDNMDKGTGRFIAIDNVGAGVGENVLVVLGSGARVGCNMKDSPIDAAIVGIVDTITEM
jgi:ethanolamine utilization protein EutN